MEDQPRYIPRSAILRLAEILPRLGADYGSRDFDADLFRMIDPRKVRRVTRRTWDIVEQGADDFNEDFHALQTAGYEDWASETPEVETDYFDEDGKLVFDIGRYGYIGKDGEFVISPRLEPVPCFTRIVDEAMLLKSMVFQSYLRLHIEEVEGEWCSDYRVSLLTESGKAVHAHQADTLPHAIVGAVLGALLCGWTHALATHEVID